jgi:hypothetical protein
MRPRRFSLAAETYLCRRCGAAAVRRNRHDGGPTRRESLVEPTGKCLLVLSPRPAVVFVVAVGVVVRRRHEVMGFVVVVVVDAGGVHAWPRSALVRRQCTLVLLRNRHWALLLGVRGLPVRAVVDVVRVLLHGAVVKADGRGRRRRRRHRRRFSSRRRKHAADCALRRSEKEQASRETMTAHPLSGRRQGTRTAVGACALVMPTAPVCVKDATADSCVRSFLGFRPWREKVDELRHEWARALRGRGEFSN